MTDFPRTRVRMTAAEFRALPESSLRHELIDGELYTDEDEDMAGAKDAHQKTVTRSIIYLGNLVTSGEFRIPPTDVYVDDINAYQPDVFWVSGADSLCKLGDDGYWYGAPDLVIEVLSPSTEFNDRGKKYLRYEQYGTREYWLVNTDSTYVEVYRREGDRFARVGIFGRGETFTSPVLGGATITVDKLFV